MANSSFELPATPFVSVRVDGWQKAPKPPDYPEDGNFQWDQLIGVFKNPPPSAADHIENCDGDQAAYLFAVPGTGLFQDLQAPPTGGGDPTPIRFQEGNAYRLRVGVIGNGGGMLEGVSLALGLYFRDSSGQKLGVGQTVVTNQPALFGSRTNFVSFELGIPTVKATDPWAGQPMGVEITSLATAVDEGGYWDVDQVRLTAEPEPPLVLRFVTEGSDLKLSWSSELGKVYQVKVSQSLEHWEDYTAPLAGTGSELSARAPLSQATALFRVEAQPTH